MELRQVSTRVQAWKSEEELKQFNYINSTEYSLSAFIKKDDKLTVVLN